jgi:hypothetical protein
MRGAWLAAAALAVCLSVGAAPSSRALDVADAEEVAGTADFRNAPAIADGTYKDTIVTGESVWYAVTYTNRDPFKVESELADVDVAGDDDLTLTMRFVSPTLDAPLEGQTIDGSASYGGAETNTWYLEAVLDTEGRLGVQHTLLFSVSGARSDGFEACDDASGCTLDEDYAQVTAQVGDLREQIRAAENGDPEAQLAALEEELAQAQATQKEAEAEIAAMCAPDSTCETPPGPKTPIWTWAVGGLVLVAGFAALLFVLQGRRSEDVTGAGSEEGAVSPR